MTPDQPSPYGPPPGPPPPGYLPPGYLPPGYLPQGYGYAGPPYPMPPAVWPSGPRRPGIVTASGVLGIVTGGLTALACLAFLIASVTGNGDPTTTLLLVTGTPCAVGTVLGGIRLLGGHRRGILLGSALASIAALLLVLVAGVALLGSDQLIGLAVWVVLALPLPIVTAALSAQATVKGWSEDPRLG